MAFAIGQVIWKLCSNASALGQILVLKGDIIFYGEEGRLSVIGGRQFFLPPPLAHAKKSRPPLCRRAKNFGPPFALAKKILAPPWS